MKKIIILVVLVLMTQALPPSFGSRGKPDALLDVNAEPVWELISRKTIATVYNAVPSQCNHDCFRTASMYRINPDTIEKDRILAMERTMMAEYGIAYGDSVLIRGAGRYDGVWQVQDVMNKRFAGEHRIDFLVPLTIRHGKWQDVLVYRKITN